jgi:hypothetical protein
VAGKARDLACIYSCYFGPPNTDMDPTSACARVEGYKSDTMQIKPLIIWRCPNNRRTWGLLFLGVLHLVFDFIYSGVATRTPNSLHVNDVVRPMYISSPSMMVA